MCEFKTTAQVSIALEPQIFLIFDVDCGWYIISTEKDRWLCPCINTHSCSFFLSSVFQPLGKFKCHTSVCPCSSLYQGHWYKDAMNDTWGCHLFSRRPIYISMGRVCYGLMWYHLGYVHVLKVQSSGGLIRRHWGPLAGGAQWGHLEHWGYLSSRNCKMPPSLFLCFLVTVCMLSLIGTSLMCYSQQKSKSIGPTQSWLEVQKS